MARERKKPEGSFIGRAKNEIENEDTLLTKRAYELGRIRGRKETIEKACNAFCHAGCPHKTDSFNCLNNKCDTWRIFKRMMEE